MKRGIERAAGRRGGALTRCGMLTALLAFVGVCAGCSHGVSQTKRIRLAGAQVPLELVDGWLDKSYEPAFRVERVQPVYLSQHGFEALARGDCDLAITDRLLTAAELEKFHGVTPVGRRIAFYGFALYVSTQNKLDSIFSRHIELLFKKRIVNWKELGGDDAPIALFGPRKDSRGGTILAREAGIWFAEPTWTPLDSDAAVLERVKNDPTALGFATIGHDGDGVRYVGLRTDRHGPAVLPSLEAIEDDRYGLAKVIYVYWREPANDATRAAVEYLQSEAGRKAIERTDVFAIPPARTAVPAPTSQPGQ